MRKDPRALEEVSAGYAGISKFWMSIREPYILPLQTIRRYS